MSLIQKFMHKRGADKKTGAPSVTTKSPRRNAPCPPQWKRVLVPAVGLPFSERGLQMACRLARSSSAEVVLAYVAEVPRSLALNAPSPEIDDPAQETLEFAETVVREFGLVGVPMVYQSRNALDGILKLIEQENTDLLVLSTRFDEQRGMPRELAREVFRAAKCGIVVNYVPKTALEKDSGEDQ